MRGRRRSGRDAAGRSTDRPASGELRRLRLRFALIFAAVGGTLLAIYSFPYAEHGIREDWFARYLALYAQLAGAVLRITDPSVHVTGPLLVGRVSLTIAKNCDAMDVNILFAAAIVAFPAAWRRRVAGLAAGTAALVVLNVLRIVSLYHINIHWPGAFETVHAEVWPFAMILFCVGAFLAWSRWAAPSRPAAVATPADA